MDPLSIASVATGIVKSCYTVTATIYTFFDESRNVDSTVDDLLREIQGLSKGAEAICTAWIQNPRIVMAQTGTDGNLWASVEASLEDCQLTLAKLNSKLDELKKGSVFSRGFLRKPTKLVMLNMRIKDIAAFKGQIQSYNNAMQSALLMINVSVLSAIIPVPTSNLTITLLNSCLVMNSNSSQESISNALVSLKSQIGRVETALHGQLRSENSTPELAADSDRMTRNLRTLIQEAESLHSNASTVVGETRSTVWGGSVLGDPLSEEQYSSIRNWIPPPVVEGKSVDLREGSSSDFMAPAPVGEQSSDVESDADSDIERQLVRRYLEIALSSLVEKDYPRAESFYRKVIEICSDSDVPTDEVRDLNIMLAFSCGLQGKWEKSETTFPPIAFARGILDIRPFHGLYALSMVHFKNGDYDTATKYCKRAVGGYRRLLGKSDPQYFEAIHALALIYDSRGDPVSAEGCRTFLPAQTLAPLALNPEEFLETVISNDPNIMETQSRLRSTTPVPPPGGPSGVSLPESQLGSQASASSTTVQSLSGTTNLSVQAISQKLDKQSLDPTLSSSPQLGTANKVDSTSNEGYPHGILAYPRHLLTGHSPSTQQYAGPVARFEPSSRPRKPASLIVAVDFGTTHTYVAWAFVGAEGAREDILTSWPGASNYTNPAVPTILYYNQYQQIVGWGHDIADALAPTGHLKPGVVKLESFKLHLMLARKPHTDSIDLPPLPPGKSEVDVSADYLFKVRQAMRSQLQMSLGEVFSREEKTIQYYFTIPGIWNHAGLTSLRAAMIDAGYLRDENDNRLSYLTEGEAAAHYCLKISVLNLQVKDIVLIADCGTITVDLQACELASQSPHSFAEFTSGSGDCCGSRALNRNFDNILRTKIRKMKLPDGSKTARRVYAKCIMDFENRIKIDFANNGQNWAVDVGIEADFPEAGLEEGYMIFTNEEIIQCFKPVVNRILELIQAQVVEVRAQNSTLKNVLVIGTFSTSEYLFQQIKHHFPSQFQSKIVRPMDIQGVIVKGALAAGIEECRPLKNEVPPGPSTPGTGGLPPSYCLKESFLLQIPRETNSSFHTESKSCHGHHDPDGKDRRYDTSVVFLTNGQPIDLFKRLRFPVVQFFNTGHPRIFYHRISVERRHQMLFGNFYSDADSFMSHVPVCANLQHKKIAQFRKFRRNSGESAYMAEYEIVIEEDFPQRIPPILVLRTVFARSEVIGTVPLTCEYQVVENSAVAPLPPPMLPHVAAASSSRSAAPQQ